MDNQLISYLEKEGRNWIVSQREAYNEKGRPLKSSTRSVIESFFRIDTINSIRICEVSQIDNPPFYEELAKLGIPMPLDFHDMVGITFIDTVLISSSKVIKEYWNSLIFHECVHVAQYLFLGVDRFTHEYVTGWAYNGFDYYKIPLEVQAHQLGQRFSLNPQNRFSVELEVEKEWG